MEYLGPWMEELATWVKFALETASILVIVAGGVAANEGVCCRVTGRELAQGHADQAIALFVAGAGAGVAVAVGRRHLGHGNFTHMGTVGQAGRDSGHPDISGLLSR